jgi:RNA polymerase sigma factor (sigma-70 family)
MDGCEGEHVSTADGLAGIAHDPVAFEAFYRRHVGAVTRFFARRVADPHLVADLTADVFVAVIGSASGYAPDRGSELGWLYGVARNVLASQRRRTAQELQATRRIAGRRLLDDDDITRLEARIDAESAARSLHQAISRLPEKERAVVELVAVDGLPVAEAAAALGISAGTARVRLYRARRKATESLAERLPSADPPHTPSVRVMSPVVVEENRQ